MREESPAPFINNLFGASVPLAPYPHPPPNQIQFLAHKVKQRQQGYQKSEPGGISV